MNSTQLSLCILCFALSWHQSGGGDGDGNWGNSGGGDSDYGDYTFYGGDDTYYGDDSDDSSYGDRSSGTIIQSNGANYSYSCNYKMQN